MSDLWMDFVPVKWFEFKTHNIRVCFLSRMRPCTAKNSGDATQSTRRCSSMLLGQPFQTKNDGFGCVKSAFTREHFDEHPFEDECICREDNIVLTCPGCF